MFYVEELGLDLHCRNELYEKNSIFASTAGQVVLDVGCGTGYFVNKISPFAKKVIGLDIDGQNIKVAQHINKNTNVEFQQGDGMQLPLPDNFADSLLCTSVLEHFSDPEKAINEFIRVLKPQGTLIIGFDQKPAISHFVYTIPSRLTKMWQSSADLPQVHKHTVFSDDSDKNDWFLSQQKVADFLQKDFTIEKTDTAGGIFTNLLIAFIITLEKLRGIITKQNPEASNIGHHLERLNTPVMHAYRKLFLPMAKLIMKHDIIKRDAQFCLMICRKRT